MMMMILKYKYIIIKTTGGSEEKKMICLKWGVPQGNPLRQSRVVYLRAPARPNALALHILNTMRMVKCPLWFFGIEYPNNNNNCLILHTQFLACLKWQTVILFVVVEMLRQVTAVLQNYKGLISPGHEKEVDNMICSKFL